uniref:Rab-like protein 2A n=1 Tax=Castor canadensis TaxID=51338 RepID=A0A8C0WID9_CASCN
MAENKTKPYELDQEKYDADDNVKIICLGDSAVGKSKCLMYREKSPIRTWIPADMQVTQKSFNFAKKFSLPMYFVSAANGTNVVKLFNDAIRLAVSYKQNSQDFMDEVLQELENFKLEQKEEDEPDQEQCGRIESPS